jgi:hypothetical protein
MAEESGGEQMRKGSAILAVSLALTIASLAGAGDKPATIKLVRPTATAQWTVTRSDFGGFTEFSGSVWVKGTLVAGWLREFDSNVPNEMVIWLKIDEKSVASLPAFFQPQMPQDRPDGLVKIENVEEALGIAFPPVQLAQFRKQEFRTLKVDASFLIRDYKLLRECDHTYAFANLTAIETPNMLTADNRRVSEGC